MNDRNSFSLHYIQKFTSNVFELSKQFYNNQKVILIINSFEKDLVRRSFQNERKEEGEGEGEDEDEDEDVVDVVENFVLSFGLLYDLLMNFCTRLKQLRILCLFSGFILIVNCT
jgi:hypothetical protein